MHKNVDQATDLAQMPWLAKLFLIKQQLLSLMVVLGSKGEDLSSLAPAGEVWRTGANEASTITFSSDVNFGGEAVSAGTYTLYTIPGENWTFILNNQLRRGEEDDRPTWGAYSYDESNDQINVSAAVTTTDAVFMERFSIYFDTLTETKAHLNLHWGTTLTAVPIAVE